MRSVQERRNASRLLGTATRESSHSSQRLTVTTPSASGSLALARSPDPTLRAAISEQHLAVKRQRFEFALRLSAVRLLATRRVDFSQEHAQPGIQLQRVAIEGAHDAAFFAALQAPDLRPAGGEEERDNNQRPCSPARARTEIQHLAHPQYPPALPSLRISVAAS